MKTQLIAALLVAVSAAVSVPALASEAVVTRAQVRAELVQLQQAGYAPGRANDPHYPDDLQAALTRIHANDTVAAGTAASGYGADAAAATQSGSRHVARVAERSIYFGH
ncbi:hypothetical protein WT27_07470 [Burkholderia territorii]|uniref:DUF4148 domain-containing protein n=1 Tax=Burkholderia territorii TaxID=1503055 RepID=A0A105VCX2_9BURK|nr:DUF4148 domain-containing protein [Burkholderia territorii]KVV45129.1 hypothetical protein WT27_07470 [Burkholderia territorii]KVX32088.1 hypothetical protein WT31_00845 [Burkholderia territorii]